MERNDYERLVVLMARMARGDRAALFSLAHEFGAPIVATVRAHLREVGVHHIERPELDGLAIDACEELWHCAAAWRPDGGALPWVWARHRIRAVVTRHVGQHADALDEAALAAVPAAVVAAGTEPEDLTVLRRLARSRPECELLLEALEAVTTPRNQAILLAVTVQETLGDPAPAATVGRQFGMQAAAVRQVKHRTLERLRHLAERDERFAPLAGLDLLAA